MGRLDQPGLAAAPRAGESAFVVAEEFALQQAFAQGRAVHRQEGLGRAPAGAVHALGQQLLARAAVALDEHGGIAGRELARQAAHALGGPAVARVVFDAPAHARAAQAAVGAQVAVGTLDGGRVAAHQQGARELAVFHDGRTPHDQGAHGQLDHVFTAFGLQGLRLQRLCQCQRGCHLVQQPAMQRIGGRAQQRGHGGVQGLDAALRVHGDHAVLQLAEHGFQPLVAGALGMAVAGQQHGITQGLQHGAIGVQQHAGNAGLLGQVGHQAGRDDGAHAGGLQRTHAGLGIFGSVVAELRNAGAEQRVELGQMRRGMVERHQPDARRAAGLGQCTCAGQRLQQIEPAHLDHDDGDIDPLAHPGAAGPCGHQGVYGLDRLQRTHGLHGIVKGRADMLHAHLVAHGQRHALQHAADAMAAHGDDARPGCAGAGRGCMHGRHN